MSLTPSHALQVEEIEFPILLVVRMVHGRHVGMPLEEIRFLESEAINPFGQWGKFISQCVLSSCSFPSRPTTTMNPVPVTTVRETGGISIELEPGLDGEIKGN